METIDINTGNYLIADFLKWIRISEIGLNFNEWQDENGMLITHGRTGGELKFHKDWNWLMPVVELIETTEYELPEKYRRGALKNTEKNNIEIVTFYETFGWTGTVNFVLGSPLFDYNENFDTKIDAMWYAVVRFIRWHNENIIKK